MRSLIIIIKKECILRIREHLIKSKNNILKNEVATRVLKNSSWLVGDKVFTMLIGIFVTAIIARYFGPENYGQFNYALSFVALFTALSTLGLETLTVKAIVDKEYDEGEILCTSLVLRVFGGIILTILATFTIRIIEPNDTNLHNLVLIMSLTMVFKSLEVIEYWIQAYQRAKISSIIRMSVYVMIAGFKIALVVFGGNLIQYAFIYILDVIIIGIALMVAYFRNRETKLKWRVNINYAKNIFLQSWYLILSGLMITLYMQIDKVMLGSMMVSKTELGVYSAAVQVASMWYFVPMAIIISFKPVILSKKKSDEKSYLKSVQLVYTVVAWMGIAFGIFILLFSNNIIGILFGPDYTKAANILSVSVWAGTFAMLGVARSTWLISEGLQRYTLIYTLVGLLVNVSLNYMIIPEMGGYGAAVATLAAQFSANVLALSLFKETRVSTIMILKAFSPKSLFFLLRR